MSHATPDNLATVTINQYHERRMHLLLSTASIAVINRSSTSRLRSWLKLSPSIGGIVSLTVNPLKSVKQLSITINGCQNVPKALRWIHIALAALTTSLEALTIQLENDDTGDAASSHAIRNNEGLRAALEKCSTDCEEVGDQIKKWTKHSKGGRQVDIRDELPLSVTKSGAIEASRNRLLHSKATLGLALSIWIPSVLP
ncbi:Hypothetical protein D9617_8g049840 [Elsinoe fawcettii]|nr:Hypothetical protein D9617_8g049840 [Elsinoe fawcettii]